MKKKLFALTVLLVLSLSPIASGILRQGLNYSTDMEPTTDYLPTASTAQEDGEIVTKPNGTIRETIGVDKIPNVNPLNTPGLYASMVVERIFERPTVTNPDRPYSYSPLKERWIPNMLEGYNVEIQRNQTIELRNGSTTDEIPGDSDIFTPENLNVTKLTLNLRDGFTWHDGTPVTPEDFVFTYQFEKWLSYNAESANLDQYYGSTYMQYISAWKKNDSAVTVYTSQTHFYKKTLPLSVLILPKHIYQNKEVWNDSDTTTTGGPQFNDSNWWDPGWGIDAATVANYMPQGPTDPVMTGCGAWVPTFWDAASVPNIRLYRYKRYPGYYWNPLGADGTVMEGREWIKAEENSDMLYDYEDPYLWGPYAKNFEYHLIPTMSAQWRAFARGTVDFMGGLTLVDHLEEAQELGYPTITAHDNDIGGGFSVQCSQNYLTQSQKFRKALAYAIDKYDIISLLRRGYGEPVDHIVSPYYGNQWYWEPPTSLADPLSSQARTMIADNLAQVDDTGGEYLQGPPSADWTDDAGNIEVEVQQSGADSPITRQRAQLIENDLEDAGIKTVDAEMTWSALVGNLLAGTFDLSIHGWSMGATPPVDLFWNNSIFGILTYKWDHGDEFHNLMKTYTTAENASNAYSSVKDASEILYHNQPYVNVYTPTTIETFRTSKWAGRVKSERGGGLWRGEHMYKKMALVVSRPGETTEGFSRSNYESVKGEMEITGDIVKSPPPEVGTLDIVELKIDDKAPEFRALRNTSKEVNRSIIGYTYDYTINTNNLDNGWHTLTATAFFESGEAYDTYHLFFKVDNPIPITEQTLPMAAITGVVGAVVVGAIVYAVMRRRKPPEE